MSGGSLKLARLFGPALMVGKFDYQWIYWIAPILEGLIGAGVIGTVKRLRLTSG